MTSEFVPRTSVEPPLNDGELAALRALGGEINPAQIAADADYMTREMVAGRRELGLPEYRHRSSLHFALVANRIPTGKVNSRRRIDGLYKHISTDKEPPLGIESEGESWMAGDIHLRLVSRHFNITPGFDNRTPIGIDSLPRFRGVFTRRYLKLCRGTVELFGFIFGRASLHALSVA